MDGRRLRSPRITMDLTKELIADAIPRDSGHCMFAEAIKVAWPRAVHIAVDLQTIRFTDPTNAMRYVYLTPRTCQLALINFDQGIHPEPFKIQLRNGQVVRSGMGLKAAAKKRANSAGQGKAVAKATRAKAQFLVDPKDGGRGSVPMIVGGKTPPMAPGRRRAFGLRALER